MIRFDVSALTKARPGASLSLSVDTGPRHLTDLDVAFLRGVIQAIRVQKGVLVRGVVESQLELTCVRCLNPFVLPIALDLEETFRLSGTSSETDDTYALYGVNDDGWLDLTPLLREQAWLTIPMKPLCRSDCKGLCPLCGANLSTEPCTCDRERIDPRLAVLKDLME